MSVKTAVARAQASASAANGKVLRHSHRYFQDVDDNTWQRLLHA